MFQLPNAVRKHVPVTLLMTAFVLTAVASGGSSGTAAAAPTDPAGAKVSPAVPGKGQQAYRAGRYIVSFADEPLASYDGRVTGYPATRPAQGRKLDVTTGAARRWQARLVARHDAALARVGASKIYDYTVTNNGFAADLTAAQATALAKLPGVVALERDVIRRLDTTSSPDFLGLTRSGGLWSQLGGAKKAGAGVVVGVIDSGIWPESTAFAGGTGIPVPSDWRGACVTGQRFPATICNDKLVGARYYVDGFGKRNLGKGEYLSPRDGNGHGTHTASTAAGNGGTPVTIDGHDLGSASGMAPGAKVAAYKVCWTGGSGASDGCSSSDSVAAINDAVADGVDVLNYSVGASSESPVYDSVEIAFLLATRAGVFVAASAGNSGPGASTLDHPSPWITTVGAATFRRAYQAVELGNGNRYVGASTTPSLPTAQPLVTGVSAKLASATSQDAALCLPKTLDPARATGKIVVCDRGVNARVDKGFEVKRAGGVGIVLANTSPNSLNGDFNPVPAVHVDHTAGPEIKAYAASAAARASIVPLTAAELAEAPQVPEIADFSSRGPSTTTGGDILKPDLAAPGNDVVAAVAPPSNHGRSWDFLSGTSMASPHIAGIGALLRAQHPDWLPSQIKSALMTSARDTVSSANDPFAQGAGFVEPNAAGDPGLTYPATYQEYVSYLRHLGAVTSEGAKISGTDLNQPSIGIGALAGSKTVTRRVKNESSQTVTYSGAATLPGMTVAVSPSTLTLRPGEEQSFTVSFTRGIAVLGEYTKGSLTWSSATHRVRIPVAVRPVAIQAPTEIHAAASASGKQSYAVTPGTSGTLTTTVDGLVGVTPTQGSVTTGAFDTEAPVADADTKAFQVTVPAGSVAARFSADAADDSADLDLFVYRDGELVDLSAAAAADEQVTMLAPAAGTYDVYVNGFATPGGSSAFGIANFVVTPGSSGNAAVTPSPASSTQGTPLELSASWTGLDQAKRWFGVISYSGAADKTYLSVG